MSAQPALVISQDLSIYHAAALKPLLLDALAVSDELELNLSQVEKIDAAGLQLLVLLKKEAQRCGKRVRIVAHSQAVSSLIDFCNMAAELGDPLIIPAREAA